MKELDIDINVILGNARKEMAIRRDIEREIELNDAISNSWYAWRLEGSPFITYDELMELIKNWKH